MVLTMDGLTDDLDSKIMRMKSDGFNFGLVAHVGMTTQPLADYFANAFDADSVFLPSLNRRKGISASAVKKLNHIYQFLPEGLLRLLSVGYKVVYRNSHRELPKRVPLEEIEEGDSQLLLVDDNSLTGSTFEIWKDRIRGVSDRPVATFSVTVTGDYRPDYFCYDGWRSFSWRPIGI